MMPARRTPPMTRMRALYCVVQYVPDGGRAEAANVGVALFVPGEGRPRVRMSPTLARVRKFFSPDKKQFRWIELAADALKYRLESAAGGEFASEAEFITFVGARADAVRLTPPRPTVTDDPAAKLDALYAKLVGDEKPYAKGVAPRWSAYLPRVKAVFERLQTERRAWTPGKLRVPVIGTKLDIPLAYKNGRVNYVLPTPLPPAKLLESKVEMIGFRGQLIYQHKVEGEDSKLVVLSAAPAGDREAEARCAQVLADCHVKFVPYAESDAFAAEVEREAHV